MDELHEEIDFDWVGSLMLNGKMRLFGKDKEGVFYLLKEEEGKKGEDGKYYWEVA